MTEELYIEAVSFAARRAILSNGKTVPITNFFDCQGQPTDDPDLALTFVAGEGTTWLVGSCKDYEFKKFN